MDGEKDFVVAPGLKVRVTLRYCPDSPSWLGGPYKWSATPIWNTRRRLGAGYSLTQAGNGQTGYDILTSVTGSARGWFARLKGKRPRQVVADENMINFSSALNEWLAQEGAI